MADRFDETPSLPLELDQKPASHQKRLSTEIAASKQAYLDPEKRSHSHSNSVYDDDDINVAFVNGEPVISTGKDVSRFVVDLRDDEDPSLTFRSIVLGSVFAGLGATLYQVSFPGFIVIGV